MAKIKQLSSTVQPGTAQGWARADSLPVPPRHEHEEGEWLISLTKRKKKNRINSYCWYLHGSPTFFFFKKHWTWLGKWAWKKPWQWLLQSIMIHCKKSIKCIRNTLLCLCWGKPTCLRGTQLLENPQQLNQSAKKHISKGEIWYWLCRGLAEKCNVFSSVASLTFVILQMLLLSDSSIPL